MQLMDADSVRDGQNRGRSSTDWPDSGFTGLLPHTLENKGNEATTRDSRESGKNRRRAKGDPRPGKHVSRGEHRTGVPLGTTSPIDGPVARSHGRCQGSVRGVHEGMGGSCRLVDEIERHR